MCWVLSWKLFLKAHLGWGNGQMSTGTGPHLCKEGGALWGAEGTGRGSLDSACDIHVCASLTQGPVLVQMLPERPDFDFDYGSPETE